MLFSNFSMSSCHLQELTLQLQKAEKTCFKMATTNGPIPRLPFLAFFSPLHLHPKFSCSSTKSGAKPIYFRAFGLLGIHTIVPAKGMQRPSAKPNLFFCGTNLTNSDEFRQIPCQCGHGLFGSSSCCDYS